MRFNDQVIIFYPHIPGVLGIKFRLIISPTTNVRASITQIIIPFTGVGLSRVVELIRPDERWLVSRLATEKETTQRYPYQNSFDHTSFWPSENQLPESSLNKASIP